ncbi:MAG: hypothetical protein ACPLSP_05220 [Fervidicoccus fontis]
MGNGTGHQGAGGGASTSSSSTRCGGRMRVAVVLGTRPKIIKLTKVFILPQSITS